MKIEEKDPNFKQPENTGGLIYKDVRKTAASFHGGLYEEGYVRVRREVCDSINPIISSLNQNTSGCRIRFQTNSSRIGIKAYLTEEYDMPHMPLTGSSSIDVFTGEEKNLCYRLTIPPIKNPTYLEGELSLEGQMGQMTSVTLYLPLYNGITALEIGIEAGAMLSPPSPYGITKPVVFYGSSITQGGCASRPANSYPAMVCRALGCDFLNLGYSGQAKGDIALADYIAKLEMSCFVYDYDHNAPDSEFLRKTHQPFLERILKEQPDLPVILATRPNFYETAEDYARREIILNTYEWALSCGYRVQFVDGWMLFGTTGRDCCTVDRCHPNDLGFYRMAMGFYPALKRVLY